MSKGILNSVQVQFLPAQGLIDRTLGYLAPIANLVARLYVAKIFFYSGLNKFQDWESTLYLFREEYHVPLLSPEIAAVMATAGELGFALLLAVGLFTRFAASGLFLINIVAVVSYNDALKDSPAALQDHLEWGILLALLLTTSVQRLTLDQTFTRSKKASTSPYPTPLG